jgi:hypothetical protein
VNERDFVTLRAYFERVPAMGRVLSTGWDATSWWVKFSIDITHPLA